MTYSQTPKTQKPTWFRWNLCVLWGISMQKLPLKNTLFCPFCKEMQRFCKGKNMISYCKSIGCKKTLHFCIFAFLHLYGICDGGLCPHHARTFQLIVFTTGDILSASLRSGRGSLHWLLILFLRPSAASFLWLLLLFCGFFFCFRLLFLRSGRGFL